MGDAAPRSITPLLGEDQSGQASLLTTLCNSGRCSRMQEVIAVASWTDLVAHLKGNNHAEQQGADAALVTLELADGGVQRLYFFRIPARLLRASM